MEGRCYGSSLSRGQGWSTSLTGVRKVGLVRFTARGGRQAAEEARPELAGVCYVITQVVALLTLAYGQGGPP